MNLHPYSFQRFIRKTLENIHYKWVVHRTQKGKWTAVNTIIQCSGHEIISCWFIYTLFNKALYFICHFLFVHLTSNVRNDMNISFYFWISHFLVQMRSLSKIVWKSLFRMFSHSSTYLVISIVLEMKSIRLPCVIM